MINTNKTYIGVVESNADPKRLGRAKVRVMDVYDEMPLEELPWATPWKDLNGNYINVPDVGKVVLVVFEQNNLENPEYIYADHYNVNLENKLKSLSSEDYASMKSILFDHKTQIYVNDTEGLKIDYKYNNINIKENTIDINLKDNKATLNIGDSTANQQAILGNHFIDWLDKFVGLIMRGGLMDGESNPVMPSPNLLTTILEFKALKDIKFLSNHVNIVDNDMISTVKDTKRESTAQYGDNWASTKTENTLSKIKEEEKFTPEEGTKDSEKENVLLVEKIIRFMRSKGYNINEIPYILNLFALRESTGKLTNGFDDILFVFYKEDNNEWSLKEFKVTTVPTYDITNNSMKVGTNILAFGQYFDLLDLINKKLVFEECKVYPQAKLTEYEYGDTLLARRIYIEGNSENTDSNTDFSPNQRFKRNDQYEVFISLCEKQLSKKIKFSYTLSRKSEFDDFE